MVIVVIAVDGERAAWRGGGCDGGAGAGAGAGSRWRGAES